MLSKTYRMKKNSQFDYIFKNGKLQKSKFLMLFYSKSKSSTPKIGIVVSKKIGGSVVRNRVKRLLRESIKNNLSKLNNHNNYILVARTGISELSLSEISTILVNLVEKMDVNA